MAKTFPILLDDDLHRRMKHASFDAGQTLHDWIVSAIRQRLRIESTETRDDNDGSNRGKTKKAEENKTRS